MLLFYSIVNFSEFAAMKNQNDKLLALALTRNERGQTRPALEAEYCYRAISMRHYIQFIRAIWPPQASSMRVCMVI